VIELEQAASKIRGLVYRAKKATGQPERESLYREMLETLTWCLGWLEEPHPNEEPLKFALHALMQSARRTELGNWYVTDVELYTWAMDQLDTLIPVMP
jgi:hypothetical protein